MKQGDKLPRQQVTHFFTKCKLDDEEDHINKAFAALFNGIPT